MLRYISLLFHLSGKCLINIFTLSPPAPLWPWAGQTWASHSPSSCVARVWWAGTCSSWSPAPAAPSEAWWWPDLCLLCLVKRTHYPAWCPPCSLVCQVCQLFLTHWRGWRDWAPWAWQSPGSGSRGRGWRPAPAPAGCRGWPPAHWPRPAAPPPSPLSGWSWSRSGNSEGMSRSAAWRGWRPRWWCSRGAAARRPVAAPPHWGGEPLKWRKCH